MYWLKSALEQRMTPEYNQSLNGAGAERLWAEAAYVDAMKFFVKHAAEESASRTMALRGTLLSLRNQEANGARAAQRSREASRNSGSGN